MVGPCFSFVPSLLRYSQDHPLGGLTLSHLYSNALRSFLRTLTVTLCCCLIFLLIGWSGEETNKAQSSHASSVKTQRRLCLSSIMYLGAASPGILLHGKLDRQGPGHLLVFLSVKFCLTKRCCWHFLSPLSKISPSQCKPWPITCKRHPTAHTDNDLLFLCKRKSRGKKMLVFSSSIMLELGLCDLESFLRGYFTFSKGFPGSRHLVHVQGWKGWRKR